MLRKNNSGMSLCLFVILQLHDPSSGDSGDQLMKTTYYAYRSSNKIKWLWNTNGLASLEETMFVYNNILLEHL